MILPQSQIRSRELDDEIRSYKETILRLQQQLSQNLQSNHKQSDNAAWSQREGGWECGEEVGVGWPGGIVRVFGMGTPCVVELRRKHSNPPLLLLLLIILRHWRATVARSVRWYLWWCSHANRWYGSKVTLRAAVERWCEWQRSTAVLRRALVSLVATSRLLLLWQGLSAWRTIASRRVQHSAACIILRNMLTPSLRKAFLAWIESVFSRTKMCRLMSKWSRHVIVDHLRHRLTEWQRVIREEKKIKRCFSLLFIRHSGGRLRSAFQHLKVYRRVCKYERACHQHAHRVLTARHRRIKTRVAQAWIRHVRAQQAESAQYRHFSRRRARSLQKEAWCKFKKACKSFCHARCLLLQVALRFRHDFVGHILLVWRDHVAGTHKFRSVAQKLRRLTSSAAFKAWLSFSLDCKEEKSLREIAEDDSQARLAVEAEHKKHREQYQQRQHRLLLAAALRYSSQMILHHLSQFLEEWHLVARRGSKCNRIVQRNTEKLLFSRERDVFGAWAEWHFSNKQQRENVELNSRQLDVLASWLGMRQSRLSEAPIRGSVFSSWCQLAAVRRVLSRRQGNVLRRRHHKLQLVYVHVWRKHLKNTRRLGSCTSARRIRSLKIWLGKWMLASALIRGRRKVLHVLGRRQRLLRVQRRFSEWHTHALEQKRMEAVCTKVLRNMIHRNLSMAFGAWSATVTAHMKWLQRFNTCVRVHSKQVMREWRLASNSHSYARRVRGRLLSSSCTNRQRQIVLYNFAHWRAAARSEHVRGVAILRMISRGNGARYRSALLLWGLFVNHRRKKRQLHVLLSCCGRAGVETSTAMGYLRRRSRVSQRSRVALHALLSEWHRHSASGKQCRALFNALLARRVRRMLLYSLQSWCQTIRQVFLLAGTAKKVLHMVKWRRRACLLRLSFWAFQPCAYQSGLLRQALASSLLRQRKRQGVYKALITWARASCPFSSEASAIMQERLAVTCHGLQRKMHFMRAFCRWREVAREHLLQLVAAKTDATTKSAKEKDRDAEMMRRENRKLVKRLQEQEADKSDLLRHLEQETHSASAATQDAIRLRRQLEDLDQEARAVSAGLLWEKSERERERRESEQRHRELYQQVDEQQRVYEQQAFVMHNQNLALSSATQQALEGAVSDVLGLGSGGGGGWSSLSQGNNGHNHSNGRGQNHWSHFTTVGGNNRSGQAHDIGAGEGGGAGAGGGTGTGRGEGEGGGGGVGTGGGGYSLNVGGGKMGKVPCAELDVLMESVSRSLSTHIKASRTSLAVAAGGGSAGERGSRGGGLRAGGGGGGGGGSVWESDSESSVFPSNISSRWSSPIKLSQVLS